MASSYSDVSSKLTAPTKKSVFERQKAEAEAKKAREEAETAAVYEDFVKSFDDEGDIHPPPTISSSSAARRPGYGGSGLSGGPAGGLGKRHFTSSGLKSGPGSLGSSPSFPKSGPGSLGPTPSYGKKRQYDDFTGRRDRDRDRSDRIFSYNGDRDNRRDSGAFSRDEEEAGDADELKAAAKPTLHLSSLPPGTSPAVIKALLTPSPLVVENVRILPAASGAERKSISAIVTLAAETPATDIDTMVSHLQNKYLGFGFNLSISRHLSSAALAGPGVLSTPALSLNDLPFGAKPIAQHSSLSRAPPPGHGPSRFAPPASYTSTTPYGPRSNMVQTQVIVQPPSDLKQLKLIHKTLEALLTYGPEFEALLMSRPQIQRDEQWAWLWNSRSAGGVYYRWRLWEILTNARTRQQRQSQRVGYGMRPPSDVLFDGHSVWLAPEDDLKFEYTTKLEEFVSDDDYNSSDEEDDHDDDYNNRSLAKRHKDHRGIGGPQDPVPDHDGMGYLNPLAKTKLVHLLSRLPESNAKLRKGDVARITGFAIEHARAGADEVAALVTRNVVQPFCFTNTAGEKDANVGVEDDLSAAGEPGAKSETKEREKDKRDSTPASLVGLYVISDILSSSASAGVRHAWRYRALFEAALRQQQVFEKLGRVDRDLAWGKLKAEKWKRSVQTLLSLWEGWCVFPQASQEEFFNSFLNPPLTEKEKELAEREEKRKAEEEARRAKVNKWRSVEEGGRADVDVDTRDRDVDGRPMDDDLDGRAMDDAEDEDAGELLDEDIDGVPMLDSSDDECEQQHPDAQELEQQDNPTPAPPEGRVKGAAQAPPKDHLLDHVSVPAPAPTPALQAGATTGPSKRQRMRAVDMFAEDNSD